MSDKTIKDFYSEFLDESKPAIKAMVTEFDRKKQAVQYKRRTRKKSGSLDLNRIGTYRFSENLFKNKQIDGKSSSHGVYAMVDWSGSMQGILTQTVKQAIILAKFCYQCKIDFDISIFRTNRDGDNNITDIKKGVAKRGTNISMINSDMSRAQFERACYGFFVIASLVEARVNAPEFYGFKSEEHLNDMYRKYNLQGTPLNNCLVAYMDVVRERTIKHKIQNPNLVVLSDGVSESMWMSGIDGETTSWSGNKVYIDPLNNKVIENFNHNIDKLGFSVSRASIETSSLIEWYNSHGIDTTCIFIQQRVATPARAAKQINSNLGNYSRHNRELLKDKIVKSNIRGVMSVEGLLNYNDFFIADAREVFPGGAIAPPNFRSRRFINFGDEDTGPALNDMIEEDMSVNKIASAFASKLESQNARKALGLLVAKKIAKNF